MFWKQHQPLMVALRCLWPPGVEYCLFPWGPVESSVLLFLTMHQTINDLQCWPMCQHSIGILKWACPGGIDVLQSLWVLVLKKLAKKRFYQESWQNPPGISRRPWSKQAGEGIPHFCNNHSVGFAHGIPLLDGSASDTGCCVCGTIKRRSNEEVKQNESRFLISDMRLLYCYSDRLYKLSARW